MRISAICLILLMLTTGYGCASKTDKCGSKTDDNIQETKVVVDPWKADSIAYQYWGSPASPYRDDARYIRFLDSLLVSDSLPEALRERAIERKRIAMLNLPGTTAADFRFITRDGYQKQLHDIKSPLTLLVFYDPECPHCNDILLTLARSGTINAAIDEKKITVVAIYAEGKREVWNRTRDKLPSNWVVGYDLAGVLDKEIYNLPAMPTPYLLDSEKKVILKDPEIKSLLTRIAELQAK